MGKFPLIVVLLVALWVGYTLYRQGPEEAFGGLFALLARPQYGEADAPPGRSQALADQVDERHRSESEGETPWWAR